MLFFAVLITAGTGIYAAIKMISESGWLLIFAIWNLITGLILLFFLLSGTVDTEHITDETADNRQIFISVIAILILLALCNYAFRLHWVYTYSIAICYVTSFHNVVQDMFGKKNAQTCSA